MTESRYIAHIEQAIEREGLFSSHWSWLRNLYFREGTPQQGKKALIAWAKARRYSVTGFSMEANPNDVITIRPIP